MTQKPAGTTSKWKGIINMALLKLLPSFKDYLWGGHRLADEYNKNYDGEILAESWELSCHPDGPSVIGNGKYAGMSLSDFIKTEGKEVLGENCRRFRDFPILVKFIDAKDNLSIQVHPDNRYALKNEGQYGKTEMWYVMDAAEGAYLYYGFKEEISKEEFARRIEDDTLLEVLNAVPVHKGDVFFIESGTMHAIGKDILIAEIQQNSNVTYRVYDYGRVGKDGKKRELHVDKALAVTRREPSGSHKSYPHIADCDYFTVDKLNLDGNVMSKIEGVVTEKSFASILFLDGKGRISSCGETVEYQKGDSIFITAGSGSYTIEGSCDALVTTIREKTGLVRIGIDIGGTNTKIGLVGEDNKLIASKIIPTLSENGPEETIKRISGTVLEMLEENNIPVEQCLGAGIGIPGTVDSRNGILKYSNNIKWENVDVAGIAGKIIPLPVSIANDADCAALGEALAGAGKGYENVVLLTLGTGVGGGVVINGKLYEGGSEPGHMVIGKDGGLCTCGRKGCLESYVSSTAIKRETEKAFGKEVAPEELFSLAKNGNETAVKVVSDYTEALGTGIVNIANIFRPELILLGGGIASNDQIPLEPLREMLVKNCFGGGHGVIPKLEMATLGNEAGMVGAAVLAAGKYA